MTSLNREQWNALCDSVRGSEADHPYTSVDVAEGRVRAEFDSGVSSVDAYYHADATDIRIGDLQFLVGRNRLVVLRQHPPFPIQEWTVIYDGCLPRRAAA